MVHDKMEGMVFRTDGEEETLSDTSISMDPLTRLGLENLGCETHRTVEAFDFILDEEVSVQELARRVLKHVCDTRCRCEQKVRMKNDDLHCRATDNDTESPNLLAHSTGEIHQRHTPKAEEATSDASLFQLKEETGDIASVKTRASPCRLAKHAIETILESSTRETKLQKLDVLFIDELGQISAELSAIMDIVLCRVKDSTTCMGGVLAMAEWIPHS